jgi:hypothetical protein
MTKYGALALAAALLWGTAAPTIAQAANEAPAEIQLPPGPSHWKAEQPVGTAAGPVTAEMLNQPDAPTDAWLQYGGNYRNFRHSPITTLTPDSVRNLHVAWAMPTGTVGQFEASPVVHGGVMYSSTAVTASSSCRRTATATSMCSIARTASSCAPRSTWSR